MATCFRENREAWDFAPPTHLVHERTFTTIYGFIDESIRKNTQNNLKIVHIPKKKVVIY